MNAHSGDQVPLPSSAGWTVADLFLLIGKERKVFAACLVACLCVLGYQLRPTGKLYAASALIMPPQQSQGSVAGALAQLGAIAGVAGVSSTIKTPEETYLALFGTRRVQDEVIQSNGLMAYFKARTMTDARMFLGARSKVTVDKKTGMLTILVTESTPQMAAKLANAHVTALQKMLSSVAVSEVQQRRQFLEKQVEKTKEKLSAADETFKAEQRSGGLVITQMLAESSMRFASDLRAKIAAQEVQLGALRSYATSNSPEVQRSEAELAALKRQLLRIQLGEGAMEGGGKVSAKAVQAYRDLKIQENALEVLTRQLEIARIDEARDGASIQVVDWATPPEYALPSKRRTIALIGLGLSLLLSASLALVSGLLRRTSADTTAAWVAVADAWKGRA